MKQCRRPRKRSTALWEKAEPDGPLGGRRLHPPIGGAVRILVGLLVGVVGHDKSHRAGTSTGALGGDAEEVPSYARVSLAPK